MMMIILPGVHVGPAAAPPTASQPSPISDHVRDCQNIIPLLSVLALVGRLAPVWPVRSERNIQSAPYIYSYY
jgi:hypothetical protein